MILLKRKRFHYTYHKKSHRSRSENYLNILETRKKTLGHINHTKKYISTIIKELESRAKSHDNSALYSPEIDVFAEYTEGSSQDFIYGNCREYSDETTQVLKQHYEKNPHHIESYENGIQDMTLIDLMIMLCDWTALFSKSKKRDKEIIEFIKQNKDKYGFSDEVMQILINTYVDLLLKK